LDADPLELTNLAENPDFAEQRAKLEQQLAVELATLGLTAATDKMPIDEGIKTELPDENIR
jgi:N-acetylglucosamine-6-sulfatase